MAQPGIVRTVAIFSTAVVTISAQRPA